MTITDALDARMLLADGVHVVRWPEQEARRRALETEGIPRVLLVATSSPPPEDWDELEDWIRLPLDPDELHARARALSRRARHGIRPWVDDQGLCWVEDRWVDLSAPQAAVAELLVGRFGEVVVPEEITASLMRVGASAAVSARKTMLVRLRLRLAELGLELRNVRARGYLLEWRQLDGATLPSDASRDS
jgi:hypothetical protein